MDKVCNGRGYHICVKCWGSPKFILESHMAIYQLCQSMQGTAQRQAGTKQGQVGRRQGQTGTSMDK